MSEPLTDAELDALLAVDYIRYETYPWVPVMKRAITELRELRAELIATEMDYAPFISELSELRERIVTLDNRLLFDENARLRAALEEYGEHLPGCYYQGGICDCGLAAALASVGGDA